MKTFFAAIGGAVAILLLLDMLGATQVRLCVGTCDVIGRPAPAQKPAKVTV